MCQNDYSMMEIAEECPFQLTGADFYALCTDAMLLSISRTITTLVASFGMRFILLFTQIKAKYKVENPSKSITEIDFIDNHIEKELRTVLVKKCDFLDALQKLTPSVSLNELKRYDELRLSIQNKT